MLNELKATLSIILGSCMISTLCEYVEAALAVAHSKSNARPSYCVCECWLIVTETEGILTLSVPAIKKRTITAEKFDSKTDRVHHEEKKDNPFLIE